MSLYQGRFAAYASERTFAGILAGHLRATKPNFIFNLYSSSSQIIPCSCSSEDTVLFTLLRPETLGAPTVTSAVGWLNLFHKTLPCKNLLSSQHLGFCKHLQHNLTLNLRHQMVTGQFYPLGITTVDLVFRWVDQFIFTSKFKVLMETNSEETSLQESLRLPWTLIQSPR